MFYMIEILLHPVSLPNTSPKQWLHYLIYESIYFVLNSLHISSKKVNYSVNLEVGDEIPKQTKDKEILSLSF